MKMQSWNFNQLQIKLLAILTFIMVFISMALALSLIPLFPQPLPIIISLLIAFAALKNPGYGLCLGSFLIGFSLIYHLSQINFIALIGEPLWRIFTILTSILLFLSLPLSINRYEDAIAIAVGIIAATFLFFAEIYFLAIPIILIFSALYKKARLSLTLSYYVLISMPLQIMQYAKYVFKPELKMYPPLYAPLTEIFQDMRFSMEQVTFSEILKVLESIARQITLKTDPSIETMRAAIYAYRDSLPGIILFMVIVSGLISAVALTTLFASRLLKGIESTKTYAKYIEIFLPAIISTASTVLFFILVGSLQEKLAFSAEITTSKIAISALTSILIATPASLVDYKLKMNIETERRLGHLVKKAEELLRRLQSFEQTLAKVKSDVPLSVSALEGKIFMIKDEINDILNKAKSRLYDLSELEDKFTKLDGDISNNINNLTRELEVLLEEYHMNASFEYATWVAKFKDLGLEIKTTVEATFQKNLSLNERINIIKKVLNGGRNVANQVLNTFEQIYNIIRSLYDPSLPEESPTVAFLKQRLDEPIAPWIVLETLFNSIINLEKQYGEKVVQSMRYLKDFLNYIADLSVQSERLRLIFGSVFPEIMNYAKRASDIKKDFERRALNVINIIVMRDMLQSSLSIARILKILYEEMKHKEEMIESLLPTKDYEWEKNVTLAERVRSIIEVISDPSKYGLDEIMENLHKSTSYINECIETMAAYNDKYELLLNYPVAELAIEDLFKQKRHVYARDLPFESRYAEEYIKLYFKKRYNELFFDEANMMLAQRL